MKILHDYVLITPMVVEQMSKSGIVVQKELPYCKGTIEAIGPGTLSLYTGYTYPIDLTVKDIVLYKPSNSIAIDDKVLVPYINIIAVIE